MLGDLYSTDAGAMVEEADLIIVSVPVGASGAVAQSIANHLKKGAIVTDVGSTKVSVIEQMASKMPSNAHLLQGTPLRGRNILAPRRGFRACLIIAGVF